MSPTERDAPRAEKDLRSLMKRSPEWSCRVFPDICDRQVDGERIRSQQKKKRNHIREDFAGCLRTDGHSKDPGKRKEGQEEGGEKALKASSLVKGRRERSQGHRISPRRRTMAVRDYESKCISYINDWDFEPRTQRHWKGVDITRPRQPRMAKTNDQLMRELVQTSRLVLKPSDPDALNFYQNNSSPEGPATIKDHFRLSQTDQTSPTGPLPERAQVLLYPDRGQNWYESTTHATYRGLQGKRPDQAKPFEGSLKPEGEMEMDTTNRAAYKSYKSMSEVRNAPHGKGGMHAKMGSTVLPVIPMHQGKFYGETQAMRDFPGFGDSQPHPVESIPPAPDNLRVPYHVSRSFETEQRRQFVAIDPVQHPPPKPISQLRDSIQLSEEPFETMTNHKLDYLPIVHGPPVRRCLPPLNHSVTVGNKSRAFDGTTTNQLFFREWPLSPQQRHGDFHDDYSNVPIINGVPTIRLGIQSEEAQRNATAGDFDITHRRQFEKPSFADGLTKVQATMLLKELRRRKINKEESIKEIESRHH